MKRIVSLLLVVTIISLYGSSLAEPTDAGIWHKGAFLDEFNQPTNNYYVISDPIKGQFSNSVVTNEDLTAYVFCDAEWNIGLRLMEYGNYDVKNTGKASVLYDLTVLGADDFKFTANGSMAAGSGYIYFYKNSMTSLPDNATGIRSALAAGGTVRFSLVEKEKPVNKYVFSIINADGFDLAFEKTFGLEGYYTKSKDQSIDHIEVNGTKIKIGTIVANESMGKGSVVKIEYTRLPYPHQNEEGYFITVRFDKGGQELGYAMPYDLEWKWITIIQE